MTADKIRQTADSFDANTSLGNATADDRFQSAILAEIAAQLAALNTTLKEVRNAIVQYPRPRV